MKAFYTKEELGKLSEKELSDLTSFLGENTVYYYKDISRITSDESEFCIFFNDGEEIYTQNEELISSIKFGKNRYDLLTKSLEQNEKDAEVREEFYKSVQEDVKEQMLEVHSQVNIQKQNFDLMVKAIEKQTNDDIAKLGNTVEKTLKSWTKKIDTLNTVDVDKFDKMMTQMESITSAFSELLKD